MRRIVLVSLAAAAALAACKKEKPKPAQAPAVDAAVEPGPSGKVPAPGRTKVHHGITWYDDDPAAARAEAERTGRPLVVDLWAPWCHTCIAMQSYVLTAENLPGVGDEFVFLAVDTEKPENAEFLRSVPVEVWPTFYVLDGKDLAVRGRWLGSASPAQFARFLADGARAFEAGRSGALPADDPLALLLEGDRLAAEKKFADAAVKYRAAVGKAPADWPRRPDALVAMITSLRKAGDHRTCVDAGRTYMNETGNAVSAGDFAIGVMLCADELSDELVEKGMAYTQIEARLAGLCDDPAAQLTPDDRADVCTYLQEVREKLGDAAGVKKAVARRIEVMEGAQQGLPDDVAVMYDWNLADAYLTAGRDGDAIALLEKREKALPDSYLPPHYLARTYARLKKWDLGLAAIDRALARAYGPRKAGMYGLKVDLLLGAGKKDEARKTLEEQLATYRALPEGQKLPEREQAVEKRLAEMK
jgi:thiol-disulfide isomerase/thioredoxin/predicted negative regulator of RcsB-dependent stress response